MTDTCPVSHVSCPLFLLKIKFIWCTDSTVGCYPTDEKIMALFTSVNSQMWPHLFGCDATSTFVITVVRFPLASTYASHIAAVCLMPSLYRMTSSAVVSTMQHRIIQLIRRLIPIYRFQATHQTVPLPGHSMATSLFQSFPLSFTATDLSVQSINRCSDKDGI